MIKMIRYLFYPGVILHEFAHLIMCIFLNVKVSKLKFGLKESYVKHDNTGPIRMSLIALAPFYIGFLVSYFAILFSKSLDFGWFLFLNYLVFAFLYNSLPSIQDIKNIISSIKESIIKDWKKSFSRKLLLLLKIPLIFLPIYICAKIIGLIDKFEILRMFYVIIIFVMFYTF